MALRLYRLSSRLEWITTQRERRGRTGPVKPDFMFVTLALEKEWQHARDEQEARTNNATAPPPPSGYEQMLVPKGEYREVRVLARHYRPAIAALNRIMENLNAIVQHVSGGGDLPLQRYLIDFTLAIASEWRHCLT